MAYGTSQNTARLYAGEFAIYPSDEPGFLRAGLSFATKFDLKKTVCLPYNSRWFGPPPNASTVSPTLGELHASLVKRLNAAATGLTPRELGKLTGDAES